MNRTDIPFLTAVDLGEKIKQGEISPVEATEAYLCRIDHIDGKLNSFITVCRDTALKAAKAAELSIMNGRYLGPLHGIPFAVKDQFLTAGIRTTAGSKILENFIPTIDATVITRLKTAGAILLGKLNMSEFATGNSVYHHWGTPRNPWDLGRSPGASSSGSGSALAASLCSTSLGEDTGGSIRSPANNCGLIGLRPTYGLVSRYGMLGASWSNDIAGPLSKTAEDCAITLQAIAGYDVNDPYTAKAPTIDYRAGLRHGIHGLRIGVVKEGLYADFVRPDVRKAVTTAIKELENMGGLVEEVSLPLLPYTAVLNRIFIEVESIPLQRYRIETLAHDYDHNVLTDFLTGMVIPGQLYYKAQQLRELIRRQIFSLFDKVDILALPNSSEPPPIIDETPGVFSKAHARSRMSGRRCLTGPFNLANVPAIAIPCGFLRENGKDLPTALQLAGPPFSDGLLLKIAHQYQKRTSWHTKRPPI